MTVLEEWEIKSQINLRNQPHCGHCLFNKYKSPYGTYGTSLACPVCLQKAKQDKLEPVQVSK